MWKDLKDGDGCAFCKKTLLESIRKINAIVFGTHRSNVAVLLVAGAIFLNPIQVRTAFCKLWAVLCAALIRIQLCQMLPKRQPIAFQGRFVAR
jgi:hypothetical protein